MDSSSDQILEQPQRHLTLNQIDHIDDPFPQPPLHQESPMQPQIRLSNPNNRSSLQQSSTLTAEMQLDIQTTNPLINPTNNQEGTDLVLDPELEQQKMMSSWCR